MGILLAIGAAAAVFWAIGSARKNEAPRGSGTPNTQAEYERLAQLSIRATSGDEDVWPEIGAVLARASDAELNRLYDAAALEKTRAVLDAQRLYYDRLMAAVVAELNARTEAPRSY